MQSKLASKALLSRPLLRESDPVLVILPGIDGTGLLLEPFISKLKNLFHIQLIRYPTDKVLGYKALEALVRGQLPRNKPFFLLAESFSGPIAISIAASRQSHLLGLILGCSFARNPKPGLGFFSPFLRFLPISLNLIFLLDHLLIGKQPPLWLKHALLTALRQVHPGVLRKRLTAILNIDASKKLASTRVPMLYLRASEDKILPISASREIREIRPDCRFVAIKSPHYLLQTSPLVSAKVVTDFIRQHKANNREIETQQTLVQN